jgi:hypothetical protein
VDWLFFLVHCVLKSGPAPYLCYKSGTGPAQLLKEESIPGWLSGKRKRCPDVPMAAQHHAAGKNQPVIDL